MLSAQPSCGDGIAVVADSFTDSNGTAIASHTPELGGPWSGSGLEIQSNSVVPLFGDGAATIETGTTRHTVCATFTRGDTGSNYPWQGIYFRYTDGSDYLSVRWNGLVFESGGSQTTFSLSVGNSASVTVEIDDSNNISATITDGTTTKTLTGSSSKTGTKVGIFAEYSAAGTSNWSFDSFDVTSAFDVFAYSYSSPCLHDRMHVQPWCPGIDYTSRQANGLRLCMPLWEGTGEVVSDLSGFGTSLTFPTSNKPTWAYDFEVGTVLANDAATGNDNVYAQIAKQYALDEEDGFTVSFWFYHDEDSSNEATQTILHKYKSASEELELTWENDAVGEFKINWSYAAGGSTFSGSSDVALYKETWYHLAFRISTFRQLTEFTYGHQTELYINGRISGSSSGGTYTPFSAPIYLFNNKDFDSACYCRIKDFRWYNYPLPYGMAREIFLDGCQLYERPVHYRAGILSGSSDMTAIADLYADADLEIKAYSYMTAIADMEADANLDISASSNMTAIADFYSDADLYIRAYSYMDAIADMEAAACTWEGRLGDSLRIYLTGADEDGGTQTDPDASLGGYRSSTQAEAIGYLQSTAIPQVKILYASGANTSGTGSLTAVGADSLSYTAPGSSTTGAAVQFPNTPNTYVVPDGADPSKFVVVKRTSSDPMQGQATLEFVKKFGNVYGLDDSPTADRSGSSSDYRALIFKSVGCPTIENIKVYLGSLGTPQTGLSAWLEAPDFPNTGNLSLEKTNGFCDWPEAGWVHIGSLAGSTKEVAYYSSRTDHVITIDLRGIDGSELTDGSVNDVVTPVSGLLLAKEELTDGAIQDISGGGSPSGLTFEMPASATYGVDLGDLENDESIGLWIQRSINEYVEASAEIENKIIVQYTINGTTYTEALSGLWRAEDTSLERYELHVGENAEPDLSATPTATFSSLPYSSLSLAAGNTYYLLTNYRNRYNLVSQGIDSTIIIVDDDGNQETEPPTAPEVISFRAGIGGVLTVEAVYFYELDSEDVRADQARIYMTFDGTNPDPDNDSPVATLDIVESDGFGFISYTSSAQSNGTTGKVIVRTYRSSGEVESENTDIHTTTADTTAPSGGTLKGGWRGVAEAKDEG
ncbi:LamG domain-containing protein [Thalassoroseus pseudoceratinae]|uniref:LamG-like jellyroll fold domain-containing protein n=1 Tax=Thalassoroseus pseudoceratinae TaxID=2713176 RepID=UPI001420FE70|nr:LamG-like jellyroll fold domain-containing protein [Thalassoroseus pseudoceratinae]